MQKKFISVLTVIFLSLSLVNCAVNNNEVVSEEPKSPQPLILEMENKSPQEDNPVGVYEGSITITGPGVEAVCYEGVVLIQMDGNKIRITSTDSIRSNFNDLF